MRLLITLLLLVNAAVASAADAPNILLVVADDMGYGDLSCLGSETVRTPNLDALAESGVLCTQAYVASSVCSPSRAGLMSGRDPRRFGYEGNLNKVASRYAARPELLGLPVQEHTLADHLKQAGYATAAVGKWHLGTGEVFHPLERGFDSFCGMLGGGHHYFPTASNNKLQRNRQPLQEFSSPYLTDFFTDEALKWINTVSAGDSDQPWFLYLAYNAPHTPMQATKADLKACEHVQEPRRRTYAAMMRALDRGVGRVLKQLEQSGQRENTLVVFLSDNGGPLGNGSWNGRLSGSKGTLREGGVRVPMIWSWPRRVAGGRRVDAVVSSLDLLPTFLAAADAKPLPLSDVPGYLDRRNAQRTREACGDYDGLNLMPLLTDEADPGSRRLFWRLQGQAAVRAGELKLIRLSHRPAQLFNLGADIGEQQDLASDQAANLTSLFRQLAEWESSLPTAPIWSSSPRWNGDSARKHDTRPPSSEPR